MAPFILAAFPPDDAYDVYVEPFVGACHVLAQKPASRHYEVINDTSGDLVNFWLQMRDHADALAARLDSLPYSRKLHYAYHRSLFDGTALDPLERAARWFYVLQSSFSAHLKTTSVGWRNGPRKTQPHASMHGQPHAFRSALTLFAALAQCCRYVEMDNRDFEPVIRQHQGPRTLLYVDPPYLNVADYYRRADGTFTRSDHQRLAQVLNATPSLVALSYYDHPLLEAWYPSSMWRRLTWQTHKHSQRTKTTHDVATEVLLCNYTAASRSLWDAETEAPV